MPANFLGLPAKLRNDPLGPSMLGALENNLEYVRGLANIEHMTSGEHNAWHVPRAVVSGILSGTYSISPSSSDVTAVASPATGTVTLTLASGRFSTLIRPQINVKGAGVEAKPWLTGFKVISATSVQCYFKELTSALGGGNSWAATDVSFDIALHSEPLSKGAWSAPPAQKLRGSYLTNLSNDWNALVKAHGGVRKMFKVAHNTNGTHNVREVAKVAGYAQFNGSSSYSFVPASSYGSPSISRVSIGKIEVTYGAMTTPTQAFVSPDFQRAAAGDNTALYTMHAAQSLSTKTTVYIYKYDTSAKTWARADADFFIAVHGG